jgi:hypothetical protein
MAGLLPPVDWRHPALRPYRPAGERVLARVQAGATAAEALNAEDASVHFVPQALLPTGQAYEAFIAGSGHVPTRDNLHDLFNGLVWLVQPALKRRLNGLHAAAIAEQGVGARRGPLRDALTLFDENGARLRAPAGLEAALRSRDWQALFLDQASAWAGAELVVVGHALLEKLATAPRKALTAHVWLGDPTGASAADWRRKPWHPLPLAGIPGWWPALQDAAFYADTAVFRPPKALRPAGAGGVGP